MRRWTMFAALLVGCYQPAAEDTCTVRCPSGVCPSGMTCGTDQLCRKSPSDQCNKIDGDGGIDANKLCFGSGLIRNFCIAPPAAPLMFATAGTLDTSASNCSATLMQADGSTLCIFIGTSVVIDAPLRVTGPNPVVFLGVEQVTVTPAGVIDASSKAGQLIAGAGGASVAGCTPTANLTGNNDPSMTAGGGGAGGSFKGSGGAGGSGNNGSATVAGGARGSVIASLTSVQGGCAGGTGGNGTAASGSVGGFGGGAVYLLSGSLVRVVGKINASGAGGGLPKATGGGGGGGSGGFIGFDAPTYDFANGQIWAVGGSGAAGATAAMPGVIGKEATMPASPGVTTSGTSAGDGGGGGSFAAGGDGATASLGGGGGGGGSCGYIGIAGTATPTTGAFAPIPVLME